MKEKIQQSIFNSIDSLNAQLPNEGNIEKSNNTALFGSGSKLDSLDLINLVVAVEQNIEDEFDVTITLADERAMSQQTSPFRTVGTLTDYIEMLLGEKLND
jgi:acyl carrier protein